MLTVQYARALDGILVNAADPGFTGTDFNNHRGTQTLTEGTRPAEYAPAGRPAVGQLQPGSGCLRCSRRGCLCAFSYVVNALPAH